MKRNREAGANPRKSRHTNPSIKEDQMNQHTSTTPQNDEPKTDEWFTDISRWIVGLVYSRSVRPCPPSHSLPASFLSGYYV